MYSDLINLMDENYRLRDANERIVNVVLEHSQKTKNPTDLDKELYDAIGLIIYTDEDKEAFDKKALRMETEAQKDAEGFI